MVRLTERPDMTSDVYRGRKNNNARATKIHPKIPALMTDLLLKSMTAFRK